MSKREILKMNEELYQLSDRARDPFSGRSNRRREGLYFDALGRRRYRSPERSSRDRDRDRDHRRKGYHDDRDRDGRYRRSSPDYRRGSRDYERDEYDKKRYTSDYRHGSAINPRILGIFGIGTGIWDLFSESGIWYSFSKSEIGIYFQNLGFGICFVCFSREIPVIPEDKIPSDYGLGIPRILRDLTEFSGIWNWGLRMIKYLRFGIGFFIENLGSGIAIWDWF